MRKKLFVLTSIMASVIMLSGCETTREALKIGEAGERNPDACPRAFALYDAERIVEFRGRERFADVGFTGEIGKVRSLCRYYGNRPIEAELTMEMEFGRGPAATGQTATYEYFVAVTRKNIAVIEKSVFPVEVTFPAGKDRVSVTERIAEIVIPRANENTSGQNFEIIVGFVTTPEQRAFNAEGKRFRVSVGQN